jgi:superfamily II DNA or RNA helicase
LEGATGNVLYSKRSKPLIEEGYLTPPDIKMILMASDDKVFDKWPECYVHGIEHNKQRNERIALEADENDGPVLILAQRIDHVNLIEAALRTRGVSYGVLTGEDSNEMREAIINRLETGKIKVILSTTIFDEGVDIPDIRTLILAGGGKSKIKGIQRLGRGLRVSEGKDKLNVIEFMDYTTPRLKKHSTIRKLIWQNEGHHVEEVP